MTYIKKEEEKKKSLETKNIVQQFFVNNFVFRAASFVRFSY